MTRGIWRGPRPRSGRPSVSTRNPLPPSKAWGHWPHAHLNEGNVLRDKGDLAGAEAAFRQALRLDPNYTHAHNNLGLVLHDKGDLQGAIAEHKEALHLDPKFAWAHNNLGWALQDKGDKAGAEAAFREAIRLDPKLVLAHINLGVVLRDQGDKTGAEAVFREAIRIDPQSALAHTHLGWMLQQKGDLDGAIVAFKEALRLDPRQPYALVYLPRAEQMRALQPRLLDVLAGTAAPATPAEACAFADLCCQPFQRRYAAAVRLYEGAFAADPTLADDLASSDRYNAAASAAQAARGEGVDAPADPGDRAALRAKALGWLQADLSVRKKQATSASAVERKTVAEKLSWWLRDTDLSGLRPGVQRIGMPAEERAAWDALWADVKATIAEAYKPTPAPQVAPLSQPKE